MLAFHEEGTCQVETAKNNIYCVISGIYLSDNSNSSVNYAASASEIKDCRLRLQR